MIPGNFGNIIPSAIVIAVIYIIINIALGLRRDVAGAAQPAQPQEHGHARSTRRSGRSAGRREWIRAIPI